MVVSLVKVVGMEESSRTPKQKLAHFLRSEKCVLFASDAFMHLVEQSILSS